MKKDEKKGYMNNYALLPIMRDGRRMKKHRVAKAARKILEQTPNNYQLTEVIKWASSSKIKRQAALMLVENNPTNEQLICIIEWVDDSSIKEKAASRILEQNPTNDNLRPIIINVKELSDKAGWLMLNQHPDLNDLCFLIEQTETFRLIAAKLLIERKLSVKTIQLILAKVPELIEEACLSYLKNNPTNAELEWVVDHIKDPKVKEKANGLLKLID